MDQRNPRSAAWAFLVALVVIMALPGAAVAGGGQRVVVREGQSIQSAIDGAARGTTVVVRGEHREQVWIATSGIHLIGQGATIRPPDQPGVNPCSGFDENGPSADLAAAICVSPVFAPGDLPDALKHLSDVSVIGFEVVDAQFDAISALFVDGLRIAGNTIVAPDCDGVFVLFNTDVEVTRNRVLGSKNCAGIDVVATTHALVNRNEANDNPYNGITLNDTSSAVVDRNVTTGNCIGIGVSDTPDPVGLTSSDVEITRNRANANNTLCDPFGPNAPIGATGVLVAGVQGVRIEGNVASRNVTDGFSLSAGGIIVADFPNEDFTPFSVTTGATVVRNTATGNRSATGPADLVLTTVGEVVAVRGNRCDVGVPDQAWCER